ncbi:hypothetical protein [Pectobacterium carotovorum]|uniref:hypothetical protein n=1 Tax=Pectobacterium carotovorum TaxID=554 RepID=UPI0015E866CD|nr:hypothetical protein [Pectobacterium carotovorum]
MNIITGAAIGAIAVFIWHVIQLTRRVEKLEFLIKKDIDSQLSASKENERNSE